jgi:flagellar FliL protein
MFENDDEAGAVGEQVQASKKVGFLPGIVIQILKWAALGLGAIIFIVTVVVITVGFLNKGSQSMTLQQVSTDYSGKEPIYDWYGNVGEIRGRTSDQVPHTVIVDVKIGYPQQHKQMQAELISRTPQIRDIIRQFFTSKRAEELRPENEDNLKLELRDKINDIMTSGKVRRIIFDSFTVVEF